MASAIEVSRLGKRFRLGSTTAGYDTLREALLRSVRRHRGEDRWLWALRQLDLRIEEGEALGIVGPNGAGKTTLLRILAGITEPTCGEARVRGRVGALLDVGTGFHSELTGRENVYLSGALLGLRRAEVRRRFDEIVAFSGVERFLDTPVKRYSSGMRLRLAFAVAANIEPPIVVVDEILAVGDAAFRERCMMKMAEIGAHSRTVLFVSHDLGAVTRLCPRAIRLEEGRIRNDGPAHEIVDAYLRESAASMLIAEFGQEFEGPVALQSIALRDARGRVLSSPRRDEPFVIDLRFAVRERVPGLDAAVRLVDESGTWIIDDARSDYVDALELAGDPGLYRVRITVPAILAPGRYAVGIWLGTGHENFLSREVLAFQVVPRPDDPRLSVERRRAVQPSLKWSMELEPSMSGSSDS